MQRGDLGGGEPPTRVGNGQPVGAVLGDVTQQRRGPAGEIIRA